MERTPRQSVTHKLLFAAAFLLAVFVAPFAQAQSFTLLHSFSGSEGAYPQAGVTVDVAGNLYGTAYNGGSQNCRNGCGTVFKLTHHSGGWIFSTLYKFQGGSDSAYPAARVVFGPDGALYGTTAGGSYASCSQGCGTVFKLTPPANFCPSVSCLWTKTTLYSFPGFPDGVQPQGGDLTFDQAGNIYGTTYYGGSQANGVVYKLTHSHGGWTESVLYTFTGLADGGHPNGGVVLDSAGNLYGTTYQGGYNVSQFFPGAGVIFELTPSGSGWTESVLYTFMDRADGGLPAAGLTMDGAGNFYGTTQVGGGQPCSYGPYVGCGTVFRNRGETIYSFTHPSDSDALPGPMAPVTLDAQGNIYGTTYQDGATEFGNVFKLSAGDYAYSSLYDFSLGIGGIYPVSNVSFDSSGNLYGTTTEGSYDGYGSVWQATQ